jgi:hypothetical protein
LDKIFHYDYFALKGANLEEWSRDFWWTIPRETTTQITVDFKTEHCRLIEQYGRTFEGDCLLIAYLISTKFAEAVNHSASIQRIRQAGWELKYSDKLTLVPNLDGSRENVSFGFSSFKKIDYRMKRRLYNCSKSFDLNFKKGNYNFTNHIIGKGTTISLGSTYERRYAQDLDRWIRLESPGFLMDYSISENPSPETRGLFRHFSNEMLDFSRKYMMRVFGMELPQKVCNALLVFSESYLCDIAEAYSSMRKLAAREKIRHAMTCTAGSQYIRAFSTAVRNEGGKITGFPHGYFISHHSGSRLPFHELSTVDEFVSFFPGNVELYRRNMALNPIPRNNKVEILTDNTPNLKILWDSYKVKPVPDKIKTVMLLELSFISEWTGYFVADVMVNYQFYYELCKTLSKNGYNIIFKRRPKDISWEGLNIFENIPNLKITYDHFESPGVVDQADAVIVQYGCSSTLYYAMCTNRPVIYVDAGWEPWFPDVYASMEKRCRILHCKYDERNRTVFDEKELLGILERKPESPDTEFMDKYLFPEK